MITNSDTLSALIESTCVWVKNGNVKGTGCFVAPQILLTCAHCISPEKKIGDTFEFYEEGIDKPVLAYIRDLSREVDEDYCIAETHNFETGNYLILSNEILPEDKIVGFGFPKIFSETRGDGYQGVYEWRTRAANSSRFPHGFYKFKNSNILSGASGSPGINLRTGGCIGIVTESRGQTTADGGWLIPSSLFLERLEKLRGNKRFESTVIDSRVQKLKWDHEIEQYWRAVTRPAPPIPLNVSSAVIKDKLLIENFLSYYIGGDRSPRPFGGRNAELQKLDSWLNDTTAPTLAIYTGTAGMGKSTILAHWFKSLAARHDIESIFVPVSIRFGFNSEPQIFGYICSRLLQLVTPNEAVNSLHQDKRALFTYLVGQHVRYPKTVLLIIDGLDEAAGWDVDISLFPTNTSLQIKILLSARDIANRRGFGWLQALGWDRQGYACWFKLGPLSLLKIQEAMKQIGGEYAIAADDPIVLTRIFELTGGDPLILCLLFEEIAGKKASHLNKELDMWQPGLEGVFDRWWKEQESLWGKRFSELEVAARQMLNTIALTLAPLPIADLLGIFRNSFDPIGGDKADDVIELLARFILRSPDRKALTLIHPRFGAYLKHRLELNGELNHYEKAIAGWGVYVVRTDGLTPSAYITRNLCFHLESVNAPADDFVFLISPKWRKSWDEIDNQYDGYARDIKSVMMRLSSADQDLIAAYNNPRFLAACTQCALALASTQIEVDHVNERLFSSLINYHIWSIEKAIDFIRSIKNSYKRGKMLSELFARNSPDMPAEIELMVLDIIQDRDSDEGGAIAAFYWMRWAADNRRETDPVQCLSTAIKSYTRSLGYLGFAEACPAAETVSWVTQAFSFVEDMSYHFVSLLLKLFCKYYGPLSEHSYDKSKIPEDLYYRLRDNMSDFLEVPNRPFHTFELEKGHQFLEYLLPFMTREEVDWQINRFLDEIDTVYHLQSEVFLTIAQYVSPASKKFALNSIERLTKEEHRLFLMLACFHILDKGEQENCKQEIIAKSNLYNSMPTINDRKYFFELLARRGFGDLAVQEILSADEDKWYIEDYISGAAPYLSEKQLHQLIQNRTHWRSEIRERVVGVLAGYLSENGKDAARSALSMFESNVSELERLRGKIVIQAAMSELNGQQLEPFRLIEDLPTRNDLIILTLGVMPDLRWTDIAGALSWSQQATTNLWPVVELFDGLAPYLPIESVRSVSVKQDIKHAILKSGHPEKDKMLRKFFGYLIKKGHHKMLEELATEISFNWDLPALWAIQSLVEQKHINTKQLAYLAEFVTEPENLLKVKAATYEWGGKEDFEGLYEELIGSCPDRNTIHYFQKSLSEIFRFLPDEALDKRLNQIIHQNYWDNVDLPASAVAAICRFLPLAELLNFREKSLSEIDVGRNEVRAAMALRFAEFGLIHEATKLLTDMGGSNYYCSGTFGELANLVSDEQLDDVLEAACRTLYPNYRLRFYRMLAERLPDLTPKQILQICQQWQQIIVKGSTVDFYTSFPALLIFFIALQGPTVVRQLNEAFYTD